MLWKRTPTITHLYYRLLRWWCRFFKAAGYDILTSTEKTCKVASHYRTSTMPFCTIKYLPVLPCLCHHSMLHIIVSLQGFSPTSTYSLISIATLFWKVKPVQSAQMLHLIKWDEYLLLMLWLSVYFLTWPKQHNLA